MGLALASQYLILTSARHSSYMKPALENLKFIAPQFAEEPWTEAEVLGSAVWLWMNSDAHNKLPLHSLSAALLPAIKRRQFILAIEGTKPVFFVSWAMLSPEAEQRHLTTHQLLMPLEDWLSGDRMWFIDWVAPFGHTQIAFDVLRKQYLKDLRARSIYRLSSKRGWRLQHFTGSSVPASERRVWKDEAPVISNEMKEYSNA